MESEAGGDWKRQLSLAGLVVMRWPSVSPPPMQMVVVSEDVLSA
jgi:hypothetical protein